MIPPDLKPRAARVEALVLDVDGCLTDGRLYYGPTGEALKAFHVRDNLGLVVAREAGIRLAVVSGRDGPIVEARARELGVECCLLGRTDKGAALTEVLAAMDVSAEGIGAIGDDLIDLPLLRQVGLSCAPADADPRVRERVHWVLAARGGEGAVRLLCEGLLRARGSWQDVERRYGLDAGEQP